MEGGGVKASKNKGEKRERKIENLHSGVLGRVIVAEKKGK